MFSENFKKYRKRTGLTQEEVAKILMVTPQAVSKWETGNGTPDISFLIPIAELFDISTDDLLGKEEADISSELETIENERKNIKEKYAECKRLLKENPCSSEILREILSVIAEHFEYNTKMSEGEIAALISDAESYSSVIFGSSKYDSIYPYTHRRLADIYIYTGQYEKADSEIDHIPNTNISRSIMKGKLLIYQNRHKESREFFKKAIEEDITTLIWSIRKLSETYSDEFDNDKHKTDIIFNKTVFDILNTLYESSYPCAPCFASYCHSAFILASVSKDIGETYYYLDRAIKNIAKYHKIKRDKAVGGIFTPEDINENSYRNIPKKRAILRFLSRPSFNSIRNEGRFCDYLKEIESWE